MATMSFKVEGLDEVRQALKDAPAELVKALRIEWGIIGKEIQKEARLNHKYTTRSGNLDRSVSYRTEPNAKGLTMFLNRGVAPYGAAVHDGSRPHTIRPKTKKALSNGTELFGKRVNHPGTTADPFLLDAVKNALPFIKDRIVAAYRKAMVPK